MQSRNGSTGGCYLANGARWGVVPIPVLYKAFADRFGWPSKGSKDQNRAAAALCYIYRSLIERRNGVGTGFLFHFSFLLTFDI